MRLRPEPVRVSSNTQSGTGMGVAAGVIGAVITIILYWIDLWWLGGANAQFIDQSGAWIVIIISAFLTGWIPFAIQS